MRTKAVTVRSYHGIGWDVRPGLGYARRKPDAIKLARLVAKQRGATRILIYKDSGELQRTIKLETVAAPLNKKQ